MLEWEQRRLNKGQSTANQLLKDAEKLEEEATIAAAETQRLEKRSKNQTEQEAVEKVEEKAVLAARKEKEMKLHHKLNVAIKSREISQLEPAIAEVKKENIPICKEQLAVAEKLLAQLKAKSNLSNALVARQLQRLEKAMREVKEGGFEHDLEQEMLLADQLLEKLRKLEEMRAEVRFRDMKCV